ncbi:hypothetical protein [Robertmurraya kyonggiensis]|uniref:Uncharacterized protein n=1 Tax=Robertmurraya kyonggiensis TaxID=1037680 RepID=A0A4U1DEZ0_9BACI|nr:hypothetical protein [Robertmurraya kyonggiensis]TKC19866.1 hypothetical protein FA727_10130 [Robertmurraya kyonggiensis]
MQTLERKGAGGVVVNPNRDKFLKEQRDLKQQYLGGARDNRTEMKSDPEYNNKNDTDISVGATGREVEEE